MHAASGPRARPGGPRFSSSAAMATHAARGAARNLHACLLTPKRFTVEKWRRRHAGHLAAGFLLREASSPSNTHVNPGDFRNASCFFILHSHYFTGHFPVHAVSNALSAHPRGADVAAASLRPRFFRAAMGAPKIAAQRRDSGASQVRAGPAPYLLNRPRDSQFQQGLNEEEALAYLAVAPPTSIGLPGAPDGRPGQLRATAR